VQQFSKNVSEQSVKEEDRGGNEQKGKEKEEEEERQGKNQRDEGRKNERFFPVRFCSTGRSVGRSVGR
jgi:hypothetical protein